MNYHQPVLLKESIEGLNIRPDGIYVDATFGGGGHSLEILSHLKKGRLFGFDQDEDTIGNIPKDERFTFVNHNFRFLHNFLKYYGVHSIDGLIADLGVSSHHFESVERGFSFRGETGLDMRMNRKSDFSAKDVINTYSGEKLQTVFSEYGEVYNARKLASVIVSERENSPIAQTGEFLKVISGCIPPRKENQYLAKVFQAIRIEVNHEMFNLKQLLEQCLETLNTGGRLVIISYHSLEDRLVKNFIRWGNFEKEAPKDFYGNTNTPLRAINRKVIVPGNEEIEMNNRARSAKLRIAEKL